MICTDEIVGVFMERDIEVVEMDFGPSIEIESKTKMFNMPKVMVESFTKLTGILKVKDIKCTIAPYARYEDVDWEYQTTAGLFANLRDVFKKTWHFYSGMTINSKIETSGDIKYKELTKSRYIKAVHYGPYQNLGKLYSKMYIWAKDNGYKCEPESIEFYTNDPKEVKKKELETILYIPIK